MEARRRALIQLKGITKHYVGPALLGRCLVRNCSHQLISLVIKLNKRQEKLTIDYATMRELSKEYFNPSESSFTIISYPF